MAVTMTTKFYEEYLPHSEELAWHDLSKIVFTSPNIDSPNTAGTRSHILPGRADLALWYEDADFMYEIEPSQVFQDTSLYYYHFTLTSGIDLDTSPTSVLVTTGNYDAFISFIVEELGIPIIDRALINSDIVSRTLRVEYIAQTIAGYGVDNIHLNNVVETWDEYNRISTRIKSGWRAEIIESLAECYIDFEFPRPVNIVYIEMEASYTFIYNYVGPGQYAEYDLEYYYYQPGEFKIQGKTTNVDAVWETLYEGNFHHPHLVEEIYMTDNVSFYTYYRFLIVNADVTFDADYGIAGLKLYANEYSTLDPGTGYITLYAFDDDVNARELQVVNAAATDGTPTNTTYDISVNVEGSINVSNFLNADVLTTKYLINVDEMGGSSDYQTLASGNSVSPVISGTTGIGGMTGTSSMSQDFGTLFNGYMDVTGETKIEDGHIYSNLSGQQTNIPYKTNNYTITTDIIYTTVVSGIIDDGYTGNVAVTGSIDRHEDRSAAERGSFYELLLTDTVGTGIIPTDTSLYLWHQKSDLEDVGFSTKDSIIFEITLGEAYDCRLTAWDDVTHSTTLNYLIAGDYVRVSALAFRSMGTVLAPTHSLPINNYVASPVYNRIFKGNTVYEGTKYYYGDFILSHRTESDMIGDYLIFKPMLYAVDEAVPYGIHDHVIVLHYTYT